MYECLKERRKKDSYCSSVLAGQSFVASCEVTCQSSSYGSIKPGKAGFIPSF